MELPITVVFEPPSRAELRALLRGRWLWVVAAAILAALVGLVLMVVGASRAEALATASSPVVRMTSRPLGADVWLDGRAAGRTPVSLSVAPGQHRLQLKASEAVDAEYTLDIGEAEALTDQTFEALLWRRQPTLTRLRATVPGAALSSVHLLADGQLGLGLSSGPARELEAWRLDPTSGDQQPLASTLAGARLSLAPDGAHVAYVGREIGPGVPGRAERDQVVWLAPPAESWAAPRAVWQVPAGEVLSDVSWSPDARRLLASTVQELAAGAIRSRLWLIEPDTSAVRLVFALPSRVVPGAFAWSPDGQRVALLAHAGSLNALCLLDLAGDFRYLADLDPSDTWPLPYPPLSWSADGQRALFAAPRQEPFTMPAAWLQPVARRGVYLVTLGEPTPRLVGDADAQLATWREDGQVVALSRSRDGGLGVALVGAGARDARLLELPLKPGLAYAAEWDVARGRVLVASRASGDVEYFLVRLGLDDQP